MTDPAAHPALDSLAGRFGDRLAFPGDPRWDALRSPWNLAIDQHPTAVAAPADVEELRALLTAARTDGLQLAAQPSGHGASGTLDGAVLVRTAAFDRLEVDADARVARIGAGVRTGGLLDALAGTGLVAMTGSNPVVNFTAFTLGGGHSWFARSYGFGSSSLRAVELLTADGRHRWLRDADDPELLWALRGAGGAFGVVTAIEVDLHPAPVLTGGRILFEATDVAAVFRATVAAGRTAPDTLALHAGVVRIPDVPQAPAELRGTTMVAVEAVELGETEAGRTALDTIRAAGTVVLDSVGRIDAPALTAISDEPTDPSAGYGWSALADLDDAGIDRLVEAWQSPEGQPVMGLAFRVLGGALAAPTARPGIAGAVREGHIVSGHAIGVPGAAEPAQQGFAALDAALGVAASDRTFCTFLAPDVGYSGAYAESDVARAARVKATVDPENRFRGNRDFV
ncbi:FAD-binding oxidoreductase [Agromyces sp. NPDC058484]|uniref:FAD-binding oxidoreductase n=1 Tax=Agromyces sp. NPDC058484 TaxID=3346524 RepID=UPI003653DE49